MTYAAIAGVMSRALRAMRAIGALLNRQSLPAVVILGIATFFAFTLGAPRFGAVAGMLFMLAVRPFASRPAESIKSQSTNHKNTTNHGNL